MHLFQHMHFYLHHVVPRPREHQSRRQMARRRESDLADNQQLENW
jgi:hypothetical protein